MPARKHHHGPAASGFRSCQHKQHDGVNQMVKDRRFPNRCRSILRQNVLQPMRAERAERHGQKTGRGGNPGGGGVGHDASKNGTGLPPVKFNNLCSFAPVRA